MKKIALVIQRYGEEVLGGAETLASVFAKALGIICEVTVLTTTAKDYEDWKPYYPEGESFEQGIKVLRFNPDFERTNYFHELNRILFNGIILEEFYGFSDKQKDTFKDNVFNLPISSQEELIKSQGPFSSTLNKYIKEYGNKYDAIIFFCYLYPTTYFGSSYINEKDKVFIYPTLHDEPITYLSIWKRYKDYNLLFSTDEEFKLAQKVWGSLNGSVIGYGIKDKGLIIPDIIETQKESYILYAGRIDEGKGISLLIEYFNRYKTEHYESDLKLKLLGSLTMKFELSKEDDIEYIGFISEEKKYRLMSEAVALVHPSPYESLSIVVLESFMVSTPVIVNGHCDVLSGHVDRSSGGFAYRNYEDFKDVINTLLSNKELRDKLGANGRKYYLENYEWSKYQERLVKTLRIDI